MRVIYKVTNKINGKIYIGQTKSSLNRRRQLHQSICRNNYYKSVFHKALIKYEYNNFLWEIIDYAKSKKESDKLERFYIKKYKSFSKGYNLTRGGDGCDGLKVSLLNKLAFSKRMKENNPILIPKNRQIAIDNITSKEAQRKREKYYKSKKCRELRSLNMKGNNNPLRKYPKCNPSLREDVKRKLSIMFTNSGNPNAKKYIVIHPNGKKEFITCLIEFCRKYNITKYILYNNKNGWKLKKRN